MKSVLAASAVMALAGSSYGFTLIAFGQSTGSVAAASSGQIRFDEEPTISNSYYGGYYSAWTGDQIVVTGVAADWSNFRGAINNSSWVGIDPKGPNGNYSLGNNQATNGRPMWNNAPANSGPGGFTANLRIGNPVLAGSGDGDDLIDSIGGGGAGWGFAPQRLAGNIYGTGNGAPSTLASGSGDVVVDNAESVFVGRFTLTDAQAVLAGHFNVTLAEAGPAEGFDLNLDGTPANGVYFYQQRDGSSINLFVVEGVPAPGALAAFGLAGLAGIRRRR